MHDPARIDRGGRTASVLADRASVFCKGSCGQEGRGKEDGHDAGAEGPVWQGSSREAPGPSFAAWKGLTRLIP